MATPKLKRTLSFPLLTLYGLGTILGAGIYVLVGKVAGHAGTAAPVAFLVAAVVAGLTGMSFAELGARYPESAGEAAYVQAGFGRARLSALVSLAVALTGVVSAATIAVGFTGYLSVFMDVPAWAAVTALVMGMGAVAAWGVGASSLAVAGMTLLEVGGLLLVLGVAGGDAVAALPERAAELVPTADLHVWAGVMTGAFVAFYAFIGFEDMVNMAEEVRDPARDMPRAILLSLAVATVLYLAVAATCVLVLPGEALVRSRAPLADVYASAGGARSLVAAISLVAVTNGALVQIVMAARVLYGASRRGWLPGWLATVHPRTRTPVRGTVLVSAVVLLLALAFPLTTLAQATSLVILLVFAVVNLALMRLKSRGEPAPEGVRTWPVAVPLLGVAFIGLLLAVRGWVLLRG